MDAMQDPSKPAKGAKAQVRNPRPKADTTYHCQSLEDLQSLLRTEFENGCAGLIPELVHIQFTFGIDTSFPVDAAALQQASSSSSKEVAPTNIPAGSRCPISVTEAIAASEDAKMKLRRQRVVARAILEAIMAADGYAYFERQAWGNKGLDGSRLKYSCRDSLQNRDRVANTNARGRTNRSPGDEGKEEGEKEKANVADSNHHRLPTYDCKGQVVIKFSSVKQCIEVVYKHFPIHRDATTISAARAKGGKADGEAREQAARDADALTSSTNGHSTTPGPIGYGLDTLVELLQANNDSSVPSVGASGTHQSGPQDRDDAADILRAFQNGPSSQLPATEAGKPKKRKKASKAGENGEKEKKPKKPRRELDPNRAVHKRNRNGCLTCRRRKVKCDEARPICLNCANLREQQGCVYPEAATSGTDDGNALPTHGAGQPLPVVFV